MNFKKICLMIAFVSILTSSLWVHSVFSTGTYGPQMDKLHISIFANQYLEFESLKSNGIDIVDWPLDKDHIDYFASHPSEVTMRDYAEIGDYAIAIYNQKWPTGVGDKPGDTLTYDPKTKSYKHYFDPTNEWDRRAWGFRLALQYLMNKDYVKTDVLKGYGYIMDTYMPVPSLAGYLDMTNLTNSNFVYKVFNSDPGVQIPSLVYKYNTTKAAEILNAAGFVLQNPSQPPDPVTNPRMDPRKSPLAPLDALIFYVRLDDPQREAAGLKLADDMKAVGIPVNVKDVEKTVAFKAVMVEYNYHLYTEGYSFGADPGLLYETFSSSQYWAPTGWSGGYQGFCHNGSAVSLPEEWGFDYYVDRTYHATSKEEAIAAVKPATYLFNKYAAGIPIWSAAGVKAYRTGWTGTVNLEGYGLDIGTGGQYCWSFLNMYNPSPAVADTIRWGFKSNPEGFNVISAEWVWDWNVLSLVYDSLLVRNPYDLSKDFGFMVTSWSSGTWNWTDDEGLHNAVYADFALRPGIKFHDGNSLTPEDVKFSLEFTRDCGPGVAWNYPTVMDVENVTITGSNSVRVYYNVVTPWVLHWSGYMPILEKAIWMAANTKFGWGYNPVTHTFVDSSKVRSYHPWESGALGDANNNGVIDLREDGTGPWKYVDADTKLMEWVELEAWRQFYIDQDEVTNYLAQAFHDVGDVNKNGQVFSEDLGAVSIDMFKHIPPANPDADLRPVILDNYIDIEDLAWVGIHFDKYSG